MSLHPDGPHPWERLGVVNGTHGDATAGNCHADNINASVPLA